MPSGRESTSLSRRLRLDAAAVLLLPAVVFLSFLGRPALWDPDEGQPAEAARQMIAAEATARPETPDLYFHGLVALSLAGAGLGEERAARFPTAALAATVVWATFAFAWRHLSPTAAIAAALILTTSGGFVAIGRLAIVESASGSLLSLSALALGNCLLGGRRSWIGFWTFFAVLLLVAGPGFLLPVALIVLGTLPSGTASLHRIRPFAGIAIGTALAAAAVIGFSPLTGASGVAPFAFSSREILGGLPPSLSSVAFCLGMIPLMMLPWSVAIGWIAPRLFEPSDGSTRQAIMFVSVWGLMVLLFSVVRAQPNAAVVFPVLPPLALLAGEAMSRSLSRSVHANLLRDPILSAALVTQALVLTAPLVGGFYVHRAYPAYLAELRHTAWLLPLAGVGLTAALLRWRRGALASIAAVSVAVILGFYVYGSPTISAYNSLRTPARMISEALPETTPIASYRTTSHTLAFYARRDVRPVTHLREAAAFLGGNEPAALLLKERHLARISAWLDEGAYIWWRGEARKVLLTNRPAPPTGGREILLPRGERSPADVIAKGQPVMPRSESLKN